MMPALLDRPPALPPVVLDDPSAAVPQPAPRLFRHRWRFRFPWVKTAVGAPIDDEGLLIDNRTGDAWRLHLGYRDLGTVAPYRQRLVTVSRAGMLMARQLHAPTGTEYLMLPLTPRVRAVEIRRDSRQGKTLAYELHAVERRTTARRGTGR
jgi:hypothetical protein